MPRLHARSRLYEFGVWSKHLKTWTKFDCEDRSELRSGSMNVTLLWWISKRIVQLTTDELIYLSAYTVKYKSLSLWHATKDSASPNKMAAKISVPVPWPQRVSQKVWFRRLSSNSFFFFRQLPCFGGLLTQNRFFFSKLRKLLLNFTNFVEHPHTWDNVESEKLSGGL